MTLNASIIAPGREGSQSGGAAAVKSPLTAKHHPENLYSKRFTMPALNRLDFEQEEPLASDEQLLGEELREEPVEEKLPPGWGLLLAFFASLALWTVVIFVISRIF